MANPSPALAAFLSFVFPGLGQIYAGQLRKGLLWAVPMLLTVVAARRAGRDVREGVDLHFARRARGTKTIVGIETAEQQLAFFAAMPEAEQVLGLEEFLAREDSRDTEAGIAALIEAWRAGDDAILEQIFFAAMREPAQRALYEAVFVKRNVAMVEAIRSGTG